MFSLPFFSHIEKTLKYSMLRLPVNVRIPLIFAKTFCEDFNFCRFFIYWKIETFQVIKMNSIFLNVINVTGCFEILY